MSDAGKQQQLGIQQAVVLPLLQSLDAMGRAGEAAAFRREFEALEWHLTQGHVKKVLAALSTAPSPPLADESAPELTITPSPYRPYQPFVDSLPGKMALVDAVEALLLAQSWDEVLAATRELFCEQLGYDSDPVVLTPRLLGKSAIQDLVRLGSFHSFQHLGPLQAVLSAGTQRNHRLLRARGRGYPPGLSPAPWSHRSKFAVPTTGLPLVFA